MDADAFDRSFGCCENVLKAVLVKAKKFDLRSRVGDKHHHCWKLFQKIKGLNIVDNNKIPKIEQTLENLLTINISSGSEHVNASHTSRSRVPDLRYIDLTQFVSLNDAQEKVDLADRLVRLLTGYF